ncbi:MAG: sulfite exporter TauE/SafE family protein [Alcaligenaceae bacterium]|nr:sulfite exporter TauE/SafE family protein [Alcaligenaceae bacterium]
MEVVLSFAMFVALGAIIGFVGALVGIGGGIVAIPMLAIVFDMPQQLAQGTGLVMIVGNVLLAVYGYNKNNKIDFKGVSLAIIVNVIVTNFSSLLAQGVDPVLLRRSFAIMLFLLSLLYIWQTLPRKNVDLKKPRPEPKKMGAIGFFMLGVAAGGVGGFFGVGGSLIAVPVLTLIYGYRQVVAQGIGLALVLPGVTMALITYAWHDNTDWVIGIPLAIGGVMMVRPAIQLAVRLPEIFLKRLFALVLILTVVLLLIK